MMPQKAGAGHTITRSADSSRRNSPAQAEAEVADIGLLQAISAELIPESNIEALYEKIVDAAVTIMRSDYASMQMLFPERGSGGELRLIAFRGFNPQATKFWEWVGADSKSTCGAAMRTGKRMIAPDIANSDFMAGSEDQQIYLQTGIRACQTTPLMGRGGNVVGMISTHWRVPHQPSERDFRLLDILARQAADLIERTRNEQQLAKQAGLLDLSSDAIIVRDLDGGILYWNRGAERLYGWTREEALGKNIHLFLNTQFPESLERITAELFHSGRWTGELVHTTRDGRRVTVLCRKAVDRSVPGGPAVVLETNSDISQRKRVEEQVRQQEEQLRRTEKMAAAGQLAASLAHEINNPLLAVTNALYLLNHHPELHGEAKNLVTTAESELARVSRIVKQSLSYYRDGTVARELDLSAIVEESLQVFRARFQREGVQLKKRICPGMCIVGFVDEVRQVVDNLLLNAVEAMPSNGHLAISLRPSHNWREQRQEGVRLTVADTGCGIPKEHVARIFEPFFTTKPEKGTGLGLWVVRGIVAKHDGRITIRSNAAGEKSGTVISILWPSDSHAARPPRVRSDSAA